MTQYNVLLCVLSATELWIILTACIIHHDAFFSRCPWWNFPQLLYKYIKKTHRLVVWRLLYIHLRWKLSSLMLC